MPITNRADLDAFTKIASSYAAVPDRSKEDVLAFIRDLKNEFSNGTKETTELSSEIEPTEKTDTPVWTPTPDPAPAAEIQEAAPTPAKEPAAPAPAPAAKPAAPKAAETSHKFANAPVPPLKEPFVDPDEAIVDDGEHILCLACGQKSRMLKRHLGTAHNMSPEDYRTFYNLPGDYPLSAPTFAAAKSKEAKRSGLGRKSGSADTPQTASDSVIDAGEGELDRRELQARFSSAPKPPRLDPVIDPKKSVSQDGETITCLACGFEGSMLKRHLKSAHHMTPEDYRLFYGLPEDYGLAAPNFAAAKSKAAKKTGLGKKIREA